MYYWYIFDDYFWCVISMRFLGLNRFRSLYRCKVWCRSAGPKCVQMMLRKYSGLPWANSRLSFFLPLRDEYISHILRQFNPINCGEDSGSGCVLARVNLATQDFKIVLEEFVFIPWRRTVVFGRYCIVNPIKVTSWLWFSWMIDVDAFCITVQ